MQCYEGKDKFIQKSILNALWSVMRGTTWTLQCIKNVIICTLIFQSISFESALNTLLFPAVLKLKQTWPLFLVSLLNAISFKHTTQASLTAQNPHTSTTGLQNSTSYLSKNKRKSTLSTLKVADLKSIFTRHIALSNSIGTVIQESA